MIHLGDFLDPGEHAHSRPCEPRYAANGAALVFDGFNADHRSNDADHNHPRRDLDLKHSPSGGAPSRRTTATLAVGRGAVLAG